MQRRQLLLAGGALAMAGCASAPPGEGAGELRHIAFGSCTDETKPQPIWDRVMESRPDLVIFGGDNVYASQQPWSREQLEQAYALQAAVPSFARLRQSVRHLAIWDDHDYGLNDGGADFVHKAASKEAFLRFWGVAADDPRRRREGIYHAETFGPPGRRVQVILLDTRWFKSPFRATERRDAPGRERYVADFDGRKTMLGEAQWQWLGERLREPADLRLIVSGMQVVADGHGYERWGHFPFEMYRLYRLITVSRANGVVFLSGDRHIGGIYRETRAAPYPLHELTSSGITHPWQGRAEPSPNRVGDLVTEHHYGRIAIDWRERQVRLGLHDLAGAERHGHTIPLSELQVNP